MSQTPSKRRRMGRENFEPGTDPNDINPYLNERKKEWFSDVYARDWMDGWLEAQATYDAEQVDNANEKEHWVTATFEDGSEEQIGEVEFDSSNPPTELEIDGVAYKAQF